jgi:RsiW-degrading membrane proteinase PrsW (M82 family)
VTAPATPAPPPAPHLRRPRWGHRTSLWQFHQPAFWLFAILLLLGLYNVIREHALFLQVSPSGLALSWVLLALYGIPVILLILFLDLYEREPISLMVGAFLWGAVVATSASGVANNGWGLVIEGLGDPTFAARWTPALTAPWVEETMKGLGVVMIYLIARGEMDDIMDGIVYGALVGLGFAIYEDVFYFIGVFGGSVGGVLIGFFVRVIASGLYGHILWTGLTGIGIAYFTSRRGEASLGRRLAIAIGLFVIGILGHFLWNSPLLDLFPSELSDVGDYIQIVMAALVKGIPMLVFVVLMIGLARRREHRWLRHALASEVGRGGIDEDDLHVLESPSRRRRARRDVAARGGPVAASTMRRLHREQINLAMIVTRVHDDSHPDLLRQREYCLSLREWLSRYRPSPPRGAQPATT